MTNGERRAAVKAISSACKDGGQAICMFPKCRSGKMHCQQALRTVEARDPLTGTLAFSLTIQEAVAVR